MDALLTRRAAVAAKVEAAEGTAETLTAAEATVLVYDPVFEPNIDKHDRNPARATLSKLASVIGKQAAQITFRTELKGSGSIATAPAWAPMLKGCGFQQAALVKIAIGAITGGPFLPGESITAPSGATGRVVGQWATGATHLYYVWTNATPFANPEVITGATSGATATTSGAPAAAQGFEYLPLSRTQPPSVTIAIYMDGVRKMIHGARGNVKMMADAGGIPFMEYTFLGVYDPVADIAVPEPTYESTVPNAFLGVNFTIHSLAAVFSKFDLDMQNTMAPRLSANAPKGILAVQISDRNPVSNIDPEMTLVADHDWYGRFVANTTGRLYWELGSAAGNKITFAGQLVQYDGLKDSDRDGIAVAEVAVGYKSASVTTGDDEIQIGVL